MVFCFVTWCSFCKNKSLPFSIRRKQKRVKEDSSRLHSKDGLQVRKSQLELPTVLIYFTAFCVNHTLRISNLFPRTDFPSSRVP